MILVGFDEESNLFIDGFPILITMRFQGRIQFFEFPRVANIESETHDNIPDSREFKFRYGYEDWKLHLKGLFFSFQI